MDLFSILGLVLAFLGVIGGQVLEGGHPGELLQVTAFMIVIIGSLGATMVATHPSDLPFAIQALKRVFMPAKYDFHGLMEKLLELANLATAKACWRWRPTPAAARAIRSSSSA